MTKRPVPRRRAGGRAGGPPPAAAVPVTGSGAPLTAREREIAGLVAEGLTDRQIAARLFISVRTVNVHLWSAYAKTGTGSRVRLVNWLAAHPDLADQPAAASGPPAAG